MSSWPKFAPAAPRTPASSFGESHFLSRAGEAVERSDRGVARARLPNSASEELLTKPCDFRLRGPCCGLRLFGAGSLLFGVELCPLGARPLLLGVRSFVGEASLDLCDASAFLSKQRPIPLVRGRHEDEPPETSSARRSAASSLSTAARPSAS